MTIWRKMLSPWLLIKLFIKLPRSCQRGDVLFYLHLILDQMLNPTHRLSDQIPMRCQIIPGIRCRIICWIADLVNLNRYRIAECHASQSHSKLVFSCSISSFYVYLSKPWLYLKLSPQLNHFIPQIPCYQKANGH